MFNSVIRSNQDNLSRNKIEGKVENIRRIVHSGNKETYDRKSFLKLMVRNKIRPVQYHIHNVYIIIIKCLATYMYYSELCIAVCGLFEVKILNYHTQ